jgi:DNA-binding NtrC family response regulator
MRFGKKGQTRILVVDDEPTIAVTLAVILKEEGYAVETAFGGEESVCKAAGFSPNLLIIDLIMGAMNGMEAATRITAMLPDCRVLFFSGTGSFDELSHTAPKRLVYSFARKPMPVPDLLSAIAYIVSAVNTAYDPIASIDGHNSDKEPPQRWRVARLAPAPGKSLARNALSGTPSRKSCPGIPCAVRT